MRGTLNIRLTKEERRKLELQARLRGFKHVGTYVRYRLLNVESDPQDRISFLEQQLAEVRGSK